MRVLIINTSERIGGAAIAANRLMEALKGKGIKANNAGARQTDRSGYSRTTEKNHGDISGSLFGNV